MQNQSTRIAVKPAIPTSRNQRFLMILVMSLICIIFMILNSPKALASISCCLKNQFALAAQNGVETTSYRYSWVILTKQTAKTAYDADEKHLAKRLWVALAHEGDTDSAFKLGMMYDTGEAVAYDSSKAAYWYQRAADKGHKHAQHNLAVAYANGDGVELDISKALHWWRQAAYQGNSDSQYNLGIVYAMGTHGIQRNIEKAKRWWRKAAISGDALAQYNLGTLYANGDGQVRSYCEATRWWEKSANAGVKQASWALEVIKTHQEYTACW